MAYVDSETCEARREKVTSVETRVDEIVSTQLKHTDRIVDLEVVMERVVTLIESVISSMNKKEEKELELEKIMAGKLKFWETKNGILLFRTLLAVGIAILVVAVGINLTNVVDFIK